MGSAGRTKPTGIISVGRKVAIQLIGNPEVLRQKLDYIHQNPVKRGYVALPEHWRYSNARHYATTEGLLPVYRDWCWRTAGADSLHSHAPRGNEITR